MAKRRIGILTSGGDCPGLNATIRGVAKACFERMGEDSVEIVGIQNGYYGLINNIARDMKPSEFSGILTQGGTILGTKRQPFKMMSVIGEDNVDKIKAMKDTYKKQKLDCLLTLGGNGTHKTANLLSDEGLNVIGLPKTIDNDIYGTDVTFGFHTDMKPSEFSGILTQGGTILGTKRQPFKMMSVIGEDNVDKIKAMKDTYKKQKLDCLLTLGGNGTHKTANLLSDEGLNVIGLPKTIDNDIYGTDVTFGFHTAVDIATDVIDRLHTTAASHSRILMVEIMGNKAGWLTLYSGIAGGADIIIIPEIPYDPEKVITALKKRSDAGKTFSIVAFAEGAFDVEEAKLKKKERARLRQEAGITTATSRLAAQIQKGTGIETRVCVPGHMLRGGSPSAYDRVLATKFGVRAAKLIEQEKYGYSVAMVKSLITENPLKDVAGKTKFVTEDHQLVGTARHLGISFGD